MRLDLWRVGGQDLIKPLTVVNFKILHTGQFKHNFKIAFFEYILP